MKDLMETDKIYFNPGDMITLRQDIPNKPTMIVVKKETYIFNKNRDLGDSKDLFKGIRCRWFTANGTLQEAIFNTKDLIKL